MDIDHPIDQVKFNLAGWKTGFIPMAEGNYILEEICIILCEIMVPREHAEVF